MSPSFTLECSYNVDAIEALYIICLISHIVLLGYSLRFWLMKLLCKSATFPVRALCIFTILCHVCFVIVASLRAFGDETIGTGPAITVFFCLGATFFTLTAILQNLIFFRVNINLIRFSSVSRKQQLVRRLRQGFVFNGGLALIQGLSSLAMLAVPQASQKTFTLIGFIHYFVMAIAICFTGFIQVPDHVNFMVNEIDEAMDNTLKTSKTSPGSDSILNVKIKLQKYQLEMQNNCYLNLVAAVLIGGWPFLQFTVSSYWFPIGWGVFVPLQMWNQLQVNTPSHPPQQPSIVLSTGNTDVVIKVGANNNMESSAKD